MAVIVDVQYREVNLAGTDTPLHQTNNHQTVVESVWSMLDPTMTMMM
jgi:hypothetical protein